MSRQSLYYRHKVFATDIADAINAIVSRAGKDAPTALTKDQVASELIRLANTDDDGVMMKLSTTSEELTRNRFHAVLNETAIFQLGYIFYSDDDKFGRRPVTPITKFFFEHVYDQYALDCLGAMTDVEIRQSLPKRPSVPVDGDGSPLCADDFSGCVVGILVDPQGQGSYLHHAWLERQASIALGSLKKLSQRIERMEPNNDRIEDLNSAGAVLRRHVQLALPARSKTNGTGESP
jgi:hypothetical protein